MPIAVCSACGHRPRGRLASIYWAKWSGDGVRDAWKQKLDKPCYEEVAAEWLDAARAAWDIDGARSCVLCEKTEFGELSELYATLFVPGQEAERFAVTACLEHWPLVLLKAQRGGEALPDRSMYTNGGAAKPGW